MGQANVELPEAARVPLGRSGLAVSAVGAGTWQWGDRWYWGYGRQYGEDDLRAAFAAAVESGITFFDTAEIYGPHRSERLLGRFVRGHAGPTECAPHPNPLRLGEGAQAPLRPPLAKGGGLVIATKFVPLPWRLRRASLLRALRGSLQRLGTPRVDLYQVHGPLPPRDVAHWARALADAHDAGLAHAVGVSNYDAEQLMRAYDALAARGVPLASNQVGFSLLNRSAERPSTPGSSSGSGRTAATGPGGVSLFEKCRELDVAVIAYGPLSEGLLTGKYGSDNPPPVARRMRYARRWLPKLPPLIGLMREVGQAHGGASCSQVALNWVVAKGAVPIAGVKSAAQAKDNAGAMRWQLSPDETDALDAATRDY